MNDSLIVEKPISKDEEDLFNFKFYSKKVQEIIQRSTKSNEPLVIGIYGKWGDGKTSFLNLIENKIDLFKKLDGEKGIMKFHFNPWRYGNEEEILFDFFEGFSQRLGISDNENIKKAAKLIKGLGRYLKAVKLSASVGVPKAFSGKVTFDPSEIFKVLGGDLENKSTTSIEDLKDLINDALIKANFKIAIFIDDIDRLDKEEVYSLLKIIKLNANFKNVVYLITMDDDQICKVIKDRYGDRVQDGRLYLEKIVQIPIRLPKIEEEDLRSFFEKNLKVVTTNLQYDGTGTKKNEEIEEIKKEYNSDYFTNPREIIRLFNSFFIDAFSIGEEVHLRDLFWLNYLKLKYSDCYEQIKNYYTNPILGTLNNRITFNDSLGSNNNNLNGFREVLQNQFVKSMPIINILFPTDAINFRAKHKSEDELNNELRINHIYHFDKYFSYHIKGKISEGMVEKFLTCIEKEDFDEANDVYTNLFNKHNYSKIKYRILALIEFAKDKELSSNLYKFLFDKKEMFPISERDVFGKTNRLDIIETIGEKLNENDSPKTKKISLVLGEKLDFRELCYFTRQFGGQEFKKNLEHMIIDKMIASNDHPFFTNPFLHENRMIMTLLHERKKDKSKEYLEAQINSKDAIGCYIRIFPTIWDNKYVSALTKENYEYIEKISDVEFLYSKVCKFYPELIKMSINTTDFDAREEMDVEDNVKQFIYHYRRDRLSK
ncbi:P-loop NTPase fold protein [Allomuricauda sp. R78024]|uniref:KAP family P-loop NTPase fold protein n=1 Tax=Allomuricauda sp. R78024 TaxID=3093867 RepID=UPI0037C56A62